MPSRSVQRLRVAFRSYQQDGCDKLDQGRVTPIGTCDLRKETASPASGLIAPEDHAGHYDRAHAQNPAGELRWTHHAREGFEDHEETHMQRGDTMRSEKGCVG